MPRPLASSQVRAVKDLVDRGGEVRRLHANRETLLVDEETISRFSEVNLLPFDDIRGLLTTFDLLAPVEELRGPTYRLWAPDLIAPSQHTAISPWVLAGDPCIRGTRIPSSAIHALRTERGLQSRDIVELFAGLTREAAEDAYLLEQRLRGFDLPEPSAA